MLLILDWQLCLPKVLLHSYQCPPPVDFVIKKGGGHTGYFIRNQDGRFYMKWFHSQRHILYLPLGVCLSCFTSKKCYFFVAIYQFTYLMCTFYINKKYALLYELGGFDPLIVSILVFISSDRGKIKPICHFNSFRTQCVL